MSKIFHYHLTIQDCTSEELITIAKHVKAKATTIDLYNDSFNQIDRMITKYGTSKELLKQTIQKDVRLIFSLGFVVIRIKLEEITEDFIFDNSCLYSEAHIKVLDNNLEEINGFKLSKNPVDGTKFYNARTNSNIECIKLKDKILSIPDIISEQYEIVHIDTNIDHDKWW